MPSTIKLNEISVGDRVILNNTDLCDGPQVCQLRSGGQSGGATHDLYMALIGDAEGDENLPLVTTDFAEAEEAEISL